MIEHQSRGNKINAAIENLSTDDWIALRQAARRLICGTCYSEAAELVNEAIVRAIGGSRKCPPDVEFPTFLANAMRSIASDCRKSTKRFDQLETDEFHTLDLATEDALGRFGFAPFASSPEDIASHRQETIEMLQRLAKLEEQFRTASPERSILEGMRRNMRPRAIREEFQITPEEYRAAQKRIARQVSNNIRRRS